MVGSAGFSTGGAYYVSMVLSTSGTPYIAFQDDTGSSKKTTVMKYTGSGATGWEELGSGGFSDGKTIYTSLDIYNNVPYVAYCDTENSSKATVMKYQ